MYALIMSLMLVSVSGYVAQYPAGLNPAVCPNYPHCDNAIVALHSAHNHHHGYHAGVIAADGYPPGVSAAACPNYPYCGHYAYNPHTHAHSTKYPAGFNAALCPNYPYCH